ncbi:hypothetical protein [Dyadobacter arcticus]|uniref:Uncharacterized protein n=1 Tax=Dyadobacter arcticus TaxID=1078754 RepID=A0ABX0UF08_9BACT|nr:hypothetical protein [Dyadobacter arcticus]NIJ51593.1 hypothetical protein [Dyadobacter arcticus]
MLTLKNVLIINALTSGATGLLLAIFPSYIAELFGSSQNIAFIAVGLFLAVFAVIVFSQSRRNPLSKSWIKFIIALDILWVLESVMIIATQMFGLTSLGYLLIGAVAFWVALMAFLQIRGLKEFSLIR